VLPSSSAALLLRFHPALLLLFLYP
jgi:hypothetical protein